jgi:tetratricopeptide (TPR) repeat protein
VTSTQPLLEAQLQQAALLQQAGRFAEAEAICRKLLVQHPRAPMAHLRLGDALAFQQRYAEAEVAYGSAIAIQPSLAVAHNNLGNVLLLGGKLALAADCFRRVLSMRPDQAQVHNKLGSVLHQLGRHEEANEALTAAVRLAPNLAEAHVNLSANLYKLGRVGEAEIAAIAAVTLTPRDPAARDALGNTLREKGKLSEAEEQYRTAIELQPTFADGYKHLAMNLEEMGRLDEAFALFRRHAELVSSRAVPTVSAAHQLQHDAEQQAWLGARAAPFRIGEAPRLVGPAVNRNNKIAEIDGIWRTSRPQIVVIDDLLTPEALASLREFCLGSTVWRQAYDRGYLGAFPEHGFAAPLIAQIAEELRNTYPTIIGNHPLLHFWGFKYDSSMQGINMHADFAAVNVNFWITPDEANLDAETGGLVVWDAAAPLDWDFVRYNSAQNDIRAFLKRENARPIKIPYRANRAVVFDSDLFHETDTIAFKPGYENRRINVTLLYGRRARPPKPIRQQ